MKEKHRIESTIVSVRRGYSRTEYTCDECGERFPEVHKITKSSGDYGYCSECMKKLYPTYKKVSMQTPDMTHYLSNIEERRN